MITVNTNPPDPRGPHNNSGWWKTLDVSPELAEVADARALLNNPLSLLGREKRQAAELLVYAHDQIVTPQTRAVFLPLSMQVNRLVTDEYVRNGILPEEVPAGDLWDYEAIFANLSLQLMAYIRPDIRFTAEQFEQQIIARALPRVPVSFRSGVTRDKRFVTVTTVEPSLKLDTLREYLRRLTTWRSLS